MAVAHKRVGRVALLSLLAIAPAGWVGTARASLIATDSYLIGPGGYSDGIALLKQPSVAATGFAAGSTYSMGTPSSNFIVNAGGLVATDPANAGQVSYNGFSGDNNVHSIGRALTTISPLSSTGSYWFSINVSQDGTSNPLAGAPNGYALAGYGNTVPPLLGATAGNLEGLFFGFAHEPNDPANSTGSLVIRYRNGTGMTAGDAILLSSVAANTTYTIIARLDGNVNGGSIDNLTYWVNPTNTSSQAAMTATSLVTNAGSALATYAFQNTNDFFRITYSAQSWGGETRSANFGDPTLGTTLADVVPAAVPEPASVALTAIGMVGALGRAIRRRRLLA
jgi:hypothetical protein